MNRMTVPDERINEHTTRRAIVDSTAVRDNAMEFYWRLKAYEDTGLDPEICAEYKKLEGEIVASGKDLNHLIELLRAENEGRLAVLPGPCSAYEPDRIPYGAYLALTGTETPTKIREATEFMAEQAGECVKKAILEGKFLRSPLGIGWKVEIHRTERRTIDD